ncbi:13805_t:CDS:2 [Funneliformis mosseae]|uniref:13805_t:CDS:1 n=1 Tax=Funneliformis mosseae TaxID=27381 RepID=A0A9N8ZLC7_FUNMO|nr:13805_t:CDS:2 [Funneliformis mosseae]
MSHVLMSEKYNEPQEGCNNLKNLFMIIRMIANNLDCKHVVEFLDYYIESRNPTTYKCYLKDVKVYRRLNECFMIAWRLFKYDVKGISN